jgi:hypothetical protein
MEMYFEPVQICVGCSYVMTDRQSIMPAPVSVWLLRDSESRCLFSYRYRFIFVRWTSFHGSSDFSENVSSEKDCNQHLFG